jgi:dihydrofolate reductase
MKVSILAAVAANGVIGRDNDLPWHLPADLRRFKQTTVGHTIVMGRKTYDSIGRPLPKRRSIVVTRNPHLGIDGVDVVHSIEQALALAEGEGTVFIIGGATIYDAAIAFADELSITHVHAEIDGDTFFPRIDPELWCEEDREDCPADERNEFPYSFVTYRRQGR